MPLWDRIFRKSSGPDLYTEIAVSALREIEEGADPRQSLAVGEVLGWLWDTDTWDPQRAEARHRVLSGTGVRADFDLFVSRMLPLPVERPETPPELYAAVADAVREQLERAIEKRPSLTGMLREEVWHVGGLREAVRMVQRLKMTEVHEEVCRLCTAVMVSLRRLHTAPGSSRINGLPTTLPQDYGLLYAEGSHCLALLPPDAIPGFWSRLKALTTSEDLWPVVDKFRDRRAVPFLIDALPCLIPDGQSHIVNVLGNLRDARAVPALQEIAADASNLLAPMAAHALNEILRRSQDDAAQLLRPTDARHAGNAGETLLRAAGFSDAATHPDELLRAGQMSPDETTNEEHKHG